jgi:hypothetical protein
MDLARSRLPSEGRVPAGTMIVSPCLATRSSPSRVTCASPEVTINRSSWCGFALAISLYTIAVMMSRAVASAAALLVD